MANPATTFCGFYVQAPDPYPDPNAFYTPFRADPLIQLGTIFNTIESSTYPLMLLMNSTEHHPIVAVAPFSPQVLPGATAPADKYVFAGDISDAGALPALVTMMNARFHLTDNVDILVAADLDGAWAILPAGEELLPVPGAVANTARTKEDTHGNACTPPVCRNHTRSLHQWVLNLEMDA